MLAFATDVGLGLHVVEREGKQHLLLRFNGLNAALHQVLGAVVGDGGLDIAILGIVDRAGQGCDGARQKWIAAVRDHPGIVQVADTAGKQLVILDFVEGTAIQQLGLE
ncbi:hypothetical protein D3C85_1508460 [compost metagenome]